MDQVKKYQRCLVMAGGGFRFAYYLGIHAALQRIDKTPDLLLASCGGAIAAAIIQALPDETSRRAWVESPDMYAFWRGLQPNPNATLATTLSGAARRWLNKDVRTIPDLFEDYLFDIPVKLPLPNGMQYAGKPAVAIIAGELLFDRGEVGQQRGDRKLFAETVICEQAAATLLKDMQSAMHSDAWGANTIAAPLLTDTNMPITEAARASICDMFYFQCHTWQGKHYIGGALDLFPIEIARQLADQVVMELKGPYDNIFAIPALRAVFGTDGKRRLDYVLAQSADQWVDTADMERMLNNPSVRKRIAWKRNRVELVPPATYQVYVAMIDAQWQFGYQRGLAGFAMTESIQ
jgi:predicted acylesterase/phospholipase RssA